MYCLLIKGDRAMKKKCDVLYIHSSRNPIGDDKTLYGIVPMGIISILNQIRDKGIDVIGLNLALEVLLDPMFDLSSFLSNTEYKILMTDLHWYEHSFGAMHVVEQSKKVYPDIPTVIGGYTSTVYASEIAEKFPCVDYIVTGDSDLPMELLTDYLLKRNDISLSSIPNLYWRQDGKVQTPNKTWVQTTLEDLDCVRFDFFEHSEKIPYVVSNGSFMNSPAHWICVARGCKFNCSYCCGANKNMSALFNRCNILLRSPEKLCEDFCALAEKGIRVSPSHDFQMFGKEFYSDLFARIRAKNVKPGLYLECFQLPTKDFIDEIAETFDKNNLVLEISPISGNEQLRKENGKYFTNEDFYETVKYILSKKIYLQLYYTVNLAGETQAQFMETYIQAKYLHLTYKLSSIFYQKVVIDPLAGLRDRGDVNVSFNSFMDYYNYCLIPQASAAEVTGFETKSDLPQERKIELFNSIFKK